MSGGPIGRDQAREMARHELDKSSYHRNDQSFLDKVLRKIGDFIDQLSGNAPQGQHTGGSGSWLALVALVAVLLVVAGLIWWRIGTVRRNAASGRALLTDEPTTARSHRDDAERFAAAGEWPRAIRERLRAIARDLEERAILDPRPGRTADELAVEAGVALPEHAGELTVGVRIFDDVWYGGRTGDAAGYQRLTELDERLRKARPVPLGEREGDTLARPS